MSNFNMPPGVNTNMIPGNRPEDLAEDAFWQALDEKLDELGIACIEVSRKEGGSYTVPLDDIWHGTDFVKIVQVARDMGYTHGYNEGGADADLARSMEEYDKETEERINTVGYACDDPMTCVKCNYPVEACQYVKKEDK